MNNISKIKNKIGYIKKVLIELEDELIEIEVTNALNTVDISHNHHQEILLTDATVNNMDDYEEYRDCEKSSLCRVLGISIVGLMLLLCLCQ